MYLINLYVCSQCFTNMCLFWGYSFFLVVATGLISEVYRVSINGLMAQPHIDWLKTLSKDRPKFVLFKCCGGGREAVVGPVFTQKLQQHRLEMSSSAQLKLDHPI
jgi:hypothetical protein